MQSRDHNSSPYDLLVEAASALTEPEWFVGFDKPFASSVTGYLATNQAALTAARTALNLGCRVEVRFEEAFFGEHMGDVAEFRKLVTALLVELEFESTRNLDAAVSIGIELWQLAATMRNGGIVTDQLTSTCIVMSAVSVLRKTRHELNASQRKRTIAAIEYVQDQLELFDAIVARDQLWERRVCWNDVPVDMEAVHSGFDDCADQIATTPTVMEWIRETVTTLLRQSPECKIDMNRSLDNRMFAMLRMLAIDLTLRSMLAAKGEYPKNPDLLSEKFLNPVPLDPFSGTSFVCSRESPDAFYLYTPGPTQRDHGGRFGTWESVAAGLADLCLDADDYDCEG